MQKPIIFLCVDLFCGAGGVTTGMENARSKDGKKIVHVVACVNHDAGAIESHRQNHPECEHFLEDVRKLQMDDLLPVVEKAKADWIKRGYTPYLILWASAECTNFSNAKGGKPRDADSRTLMNDLDRYVDALKPDLFWVENVREIMSWGPLDKKGKPISRYKGRDFVRWHKRIEAMGYDYHHELLNAADYGAHTSRIRYFGNFSKKGLQIVFPQATHAKNPEKSGKHLEKWKAVKEVLDLEDAGESIFSKNLVENTLKRIYAGLIKFVAGGEDAFIKKYYSGRPEGKVISMQGPAGSVTTVDGHAVVRAEFLAQLYGANSKSDNTYTAERPSRTITTRDGHAMVQAFLINRKYFIGDRVNSIEDPANTVVTDPRLTLIHVFLQKYHGNGENLVSVEGPSSSVTTKDRLAMVQAFIFNPQWGGTNLSIDKPSPVIIARGDKAPLYLTTAETGEFVGIVINESDSDTMKKIKEFMCLYGIIDIKMRMLKIPELLKIQGFPEGYKLEGSQRDQKKFIGNAQPPIIPQRWVEAMYAELAEESKIMVA